jgi:hypothetical protein
MVILYTLKGGVIMSPRQKTNSERTNVFFSPEVMQELRDLATKKGTSVSGLIRMIVLEYLDEKK